MGLIYSQTDTTPSKPLGMRVRLVPGELAAIYLDANPTLSKTTLEAALLGEHELIYVKNAEVSAAFAYGDCIVYNITSNTPYDGVLCPAGATTTATVSSGILGCALGAIAAGSYGWIVSKGVMYGRSDSTVAQLGLPVSVYNTATAGQLRTGAVGTTADTACAVGIGVTSNTTATGRFLLNRNP
tara:strand:- start:307 stop:858 length:552 start_codon:yes stop_codon:yes gene_type:complete